jgi:(p)ppGpp synthase/HD superfamily hydrolase
MTLLLPKYFPAYEKALKFALVAHGDQKRKYSGEPYIVHPIAVADIVRTITVDEAMIVAALLHDVVEDTKVTLEEIRAEFGDDVAALVSDLTDVSRPTDGNRAKRRAIDRAHTAAASPRAKTIKLADLIHNTSDITVNDPHFAVVYMREKEQVLPFLKEGDPILYARAQQALADYYHR